MTEEDYIMNDFIFKKHKILFLNICENMDTYPHMRCASLYKDIKGWEKRKFKAMSQQTVDK